MNTKKCNACSFKHHLPRLIPKSTKALLCRNVLSSIIVLILAFFISACDHSTDAVSELAGLDEILYQDDFVAVTKQAGDTHGDYTIRMGTRSVVMETSLTNTTFLHIDSTRTLSVIDQQGVPRMSFLHLKPSGEMVYKVDFEANGQWDVRITHGPDTTEIWMDGVWKLVEQMNAAVGQEPSALLSDGTLLKYRDGCWQMTAETSEPQDKLK